MKKNDSTTNLPPGITQRPDGRYMGRFSYQGERYTFYDTNLRKLQKKMQEKQYELEHGFFCKETNITLDKWFETWIREYKAPAVKKGTLEAYEASYDLYIRNMLGNKRLSQIRPEHIQRLLNQLSAKYSDSTIKLAYTVLKGTFKQAVKNQIISRNPLDAVTVPRRKVTRKIQAMSLQEQQLFLEHARESHYYDLYIIALNTGMRLGELRGLMWEDIDFGKKIIHIRRTMRYSNKSGTTLDTPKTDSSIRDIPMLEIVYTTLRKHRQHQNEMKLMLGKMWKPDFEDLVFTSPFGKHVNDTAVNYDMNHIADAIRETGVDFPHIHPHMLRHTFATRGLENGIPPKVMQELLGHTSITMTLDIYGHVLPDTKAKELEKIANLFN